jgi:hypothetical protein
MAQDHNRKGSTESTESASSTFPTASKAYEIYKNLKGDIERLQGTIKEQDLRRYISRSEHLISCLSNSDENEIKFSGPKLELDRVMKGMLEHAVGIDGKIYVLAAILSCESKEEGETDLVSNLKAVAETWAYYLLFICEFFDLLLQCLVQGLMVQFSQSWARRPQNEVEHYTFPDCDADPRRYLHEARQGT